MSSPLLVAGLSRTATTSLVAAAVPSVGLGAVGGAIFGAVRYISQVAFLKLGREYVNINDLLNSAMVKTLRTALYIFGSLAATWGLFALAGITLSLPQIATLSLLTYGGEMILWIFLDAFKVDRIPATV